MSPPLLPKAIGELDTFSDTLVVMPKGEAKDFDDDKLDEIVHHLHEVVDDPDGEITFEPIEIGEDVAAPPPGESVRMNPRSTAIDPSRRRKPSAPNATMLGIDIKEFQIRMPSEVHSEPRTSSRRASMP